MKVGFANTEGLGKPSSGVVGDMSHDAEMCDYKTLPRSGAIEYFDPYARAGYSYDPQKKILNSYETVILIFFNSNQFEPR